MNDSILDLKFWQQVKKEYSVVDDRAVLICQCSSSFKSAWYCMTSRAIIKEQAAVFLNEPKKSNSQPYHGLFEVGWGCLFVAACGHFNTVIHWAIQVRKDFIQWNIDRLTES